MMNRNFYTKPVNELRVYIMGPITGLKNDNIVEFRNMEKMIKEVCPACTVIVPHDLDANIDASLAMVMDEEDYKEYIWQQYMKVCIPEVVGADLVVSLNGWEESRGSKIEKMNADSIGIPVKLPQMALTLLSEVFKASGAVVIKR